jgi:hypothetical protein
VALFWERGRATRGNRTPAGQCHYLSDTRSDTPAPEENDERIEGPEVLVPVLPEG